MRLYALTQPPERVKEYLTKLWYGWPLFCRIGHNVPKFKDHSKVFVFVYSECGGDLCKAKLLGSGEMLGRGA